MTLNQMPGPITCANKQVASDLFDTLLNALDNITSQHPMLTPEMMPSLRTVAKLIFLLNIEQKRTSWEDLGPDPFILTDPDSVTVLWHSLRLYIDGWTLFMEQDDAELEKTWYVVASDGAATNAPQTMAELKSRYGPMRDRLARYFAYVSEIYQEAQNGKGNG